MSIAIRLHAVPPFGVRTVRVGSHGFAIRFPWETFFAIPFRHSLFAFPHGPPFGSAAWLPPANAGDGEQQPPLRTDREREEVMEYVMGNWMGNDGAVTWRAMQDWSNGAQMEWRAIPPFMCQIGNRIAEPNGGPCGNAKTEWRNGLAQTVSHGSRMANPCDPTLTVRKPNGGAAMSIAECQQTLREETE